MDNENIVKRGYLLFAIHPNGFFHRFKHKKQWIKRYFALFKKSHNGIQRLEMFPNEKSYLKGSSLIKIIPLNNCFRVVQMSEKDKANVFEINTKESVYYLSTESYFEMTKWLHDLQIVSFDLESNNNIEQKEIVKNNSIELKTNYNYENQNKLVIINKLDNKLINESINKDNQLKNVPKNEENILYCSIDQKLNNNKFRVTIGSTEAAIRCQLHIYSSSKSNDASLIKLNEFDKSIKYYYIVFNSLSINLLEDLNKPNIYLYEWKFSCIRRYGCTNDSFTIEVGRKAESGAGLFLFYTKEGSTIFSLLAKSLNDHVNELKNDNNQPIKELNKCKSINTLINIPQSTKYDSNMNSPSSSNASTSSIKSNNSIVCDSFNESNSFNSTDELIKDQKNIEITISKESTLAKNVVDNLLPISQSTKNLNKNELTNDNKENLNSKNDIKLNYNPFLTNYYLNDENKLNNLIKTNLVNQSSINQMNKNLDQYNNIVLINENRNLSNNKLSSYSIANLNEKLNSLNNIKLNKSLPQINKIDFNNDKSIDLIDLKLNKKLLKPNALAKPPRMNKQNNEQNEINLNKSILDTNKKMDIKNEEPIFESRLELFGYKTNSLKEENHYELLADDESSVINLVNKKEIDQLNEETKNNLIPIDTYELLVNTLNKIDEKSLNTLKKAIKKVLNDNTTTTIKTDQTDEQEEFIKNLVLNKTNQETTINYIHNDCEYAKILPIMKKKFIKKTIVEQF